MSFDIEVATSERPEPADLAGAPPPVEVAGPDAVDPEALAEALAAAVLAPRWLVRISVPAAGAAKDVAAARRLAREIAERRGGAVYDPQADAVLWPRSARKRFAAPAAEERIRLVALEWFLPVAAAREDAARSFLAALRVLLPEARPVRFGPYEPFQGRLEPGDDGPLVAAGAAEGGAELGGHLFWKSSPPCFGGAASFADRRELFGDGPRRGEPVLPPGKRRAVRLSLALDGRACAADPRWREATFAAFAGIARRLRAVYAAGYVERDVIAKRGAVRYDGRSESYALQRDRFFCGVPPQPTWLAWFGAVYRPHVEPDLRPGLAPAVAASGPEGILLQLGPDPLDRDELRGRFPALAPRLLAGERDGTVSPAPFVPEP